MDKQERLLLFDICHFWEYNIGATLPAYRRAERSPMMNIAICNDGIPELEQFTQLLKDYCQARPGLPATIRRFQSLYDLIDCINEGTTFQICLLDYQLRQPWMNRRSAGTILRQTDPEISIIGFTGDSQSSFLCPVPEDPLSLEACLMKPVSGLPLYGVLDRIVEQRLLEPELPSLSLPTPQGQRKLPFRHLIRAHYRNHEIRCYMTDGEEVRSSVLRVPFNQITQPLLQSGEFIWVSASCVVNLAFVEALDEAARTLRMTDGKVLEKVPRAALPGLKENLQKRQGLSCP